MEDVPLQEILSEAQWKEVEEVIDQLLTLNYHPLSPSFTEVLKKVLAKWHGELEDKGYNSSFLAYVIAYRIHLLNKGEDRGGED